MQVFKKCKKRRKGTRRKGPSLKGMALRIWKQLTPLHFDKLLVLTLTGDLSSKRRTVKHLVRVKMLGFYRLSLPKHNLSAGRTTSRHATSLGDGRGVPKHFRDFGKFSKCSTATLPEGFALGRKGQSSVFQTHNLADNVTVTVFLAQVRLSFISVDIIRMDLSDPSLTESLIDLIDSIDCSVPFDSIDCSVPFPQITENELIAHLPAVCQHPNDSLPSNPQVPDDQRSQGSSCNDPYYQVRTSSGVSSSTPPDLQPPPSPVLRLTSRAPPLQLRQIGPNTFEVVTNSEDEPYNSISADPGYGSQPSSSSSTTPLAYSSLPPLSSRPESPDSFEKKEAKRKQKNIARCRNYRANVKKKVEAEQEELQQLQARNKELWATVRGMEVAVAWLKDASRKRNGKSDNTDQKGKRRKV